VEDPVAVLDSNSRLSKYDGTQVQEVDMVVGVPETKYEVVE
jgi:hypothetical protein